MVLLQIVIDGIPQHLQLRKVLLRNFQHALLYLAGLFGLSASGRIQSGAGVGIDILKRRRFELQVMNALQQQPVFDDIGVIAGVKRVEITEHERPT